MRLVGFAGLIALLAALVAPARAHAATPVCGQPNNYQTKSCYIDPTLDPNALCDDGTTPAFWVRPGYGSGINTWLIWFGGGGACESQAACASYVAHNSAPQLESSNGFLPTPGNGITSSSQTENPVLYNANTIYLHYCTSDTWAGSKRGTGTYNQLDSNTWNFEGRRNATAFIKSIGELLPQFANAQEIILGGDSSGGVGVVEVANDVIPLLPPAALKLMVVDAGYMIDFPAYDSSVPQIFESPQVPDFFESDIENERFPYWNARGDSVCDSQATTVTQHMECYNTAYILANGYITIPTFVANSLLDTSQVTQELCPTEFGYCPFTTNPNTPEGVWEAEFGAAAENDIIGAGTSGNFTSFAPDFFMHVILNNDQDFITPLQFPQGMVAPVTAFDAWLANPLATPVTNIGSGPGVSPSSASPHKVFRRLLPLVKG
jgi:hypothetical protein